MRSLWLFAIGLMATRVGWGGTQAVMWREGQPIQLVGENWGCYLADAQARPLSLAGNPTMDRLWRVDGTWQPVPGASNQLEYAALDSLGRLVASGVPFPALTPPATQSLARQLWQEQRSQYNQGSIGRRRLESDVIVTFVPLELSYSGSTPWEDQFFLLSDSLLVDELAFYRTLFDEDLLSLSSAGRRPIRHSLAHIWAENQDEVVSRLRPDSRRCAWYGERPGWACQPDGRPWPVDLMEYQNLNQLDRLMDEMFEVGLDLRDRGPFDQVIFLLSGLHILPELVAYPSASLGMISMGTNGFYLDEPIVDQMPPAYAANVILQNTGLTYTFQWGGGGDTGCWDLMGMGMTGYADHFWVEFRDPQRRSIYSPARLNPVDRLEVGWAQHAVSLCDPGERVLLPDCTYILENPENSEEILAITSWDRGPGSMMAGHLPSLLAGGTGLVFHSQAPHISWQGMENVPTLVRSEQVLDEEFADAWNERYTPFPSADNDTLIWSWPSTGNPCSWGLGFRVDPQSAGTWLRLEHAPADQVRLVAQDGPWQREIPLDLQGPLRGSLYNTGVPLRQVQVAVLDTVHRDWLRGSAFLSGDWGPNQVLSFELPASQLDLPAEQAALGSRVHLHVEVESLDPLSPGQALFVDQPFLGMRSAASLPVSHQALVVSDHEWLAVVDDGWLRVWRNLDQVRSLFLGDTPSQMLFADLARDGDGSPELVVVGETSLRVYGLSMFQMQGPQTLPGWPVMGWELGPHAMVVDDPALSAGPVLIYLEAGRLILRTGDGVLLPDRVFVDIPGDCWPVARMAYLGGDPLGPKVALAGGRLGERKLVIMGLDGSLEFFLDESAYEGDRLEFEQLLAGDFLANGYCDLLAVVTRNGHVQATTLVAWSQAEEAWVHRIDNLFGEVRLGSGAESMVPLAPAGDTGHVRLAFNIWRAHISSEPDSSRLVVVDFSRPDWQSAAEWICVPDLERRHLLAADLDGDGWTDLLGTARGVGVEMWRGDGPTFRPWSDSQHVHTSRADEHPVPLLVDGRLLLGLRADGVLDFRHTEGEAWPTWPYPEGPGNSCRLPVLAFPAPVLDLSIEAGRPSLAIHLAAPCERIGIQRADSWAGPFEEVAQLACDGALSLRWEDGPRSGSGFYRVVAIREPQGPDGAGIR